MPNPRTSSFLSSAGISDLQSVYSIVEAPESYVDEPATQTSTRPKAPLSSARTQPANVTSTQPIVVNIMVTFNAQVRLDLKNIALKARNCEYKPNRMPACIMRLREPKSTAMIFASGKVVVAGTKTVDDARLASRKFARILQKLEYPAARFTEFKVHNLTARADTGFHISLEGIEAKHHRFSSYEPELFPALIYKILSPKGTLMIFHSGKLCYTGFKERDDLFRAHQLIMPVLQEFARPVEVADGKKELLGRGEM